MATQTLKPTVERRSRRIPLTHAPTLPVPSVVVHPCGEIDAPAWDPERGAWEMCTFETGEPRTITERRACHHCRAKAREYGISLWHRRHHVKREATH